MALKCFLKINKINLPTLGFTLTVRWIDVYQTKKNKEEET